MTFCDYRRYVAIDRIEADGVSLNYSYIFALFAKLINVTQDHEKRLLLVLDRGCDPSSDQL